MNIKVKKKNEECWEGVLILDGVVRDSFTEEVTFKQRPKQSEGVSCAGI